ncbi:MAG TPA: hypothetical protein DHV48_17390, partial [Prolixibacteraceae bacterium]|nr:hypothetical protein [Prolixibacteraceae bacterium]
GYVAPDICEGGEVKIEFTIEDLCDTMTASGTFKLTAPDPLTECTAELDAVPECGDETVSATVSVSGGCGNYTYVWDDDPNLNTATVDLPIGTEAVQHKVVVTDLCGSTTCYVMVEPPVCVVPVCTYTQGYYGNPGGLACIGDPESPKLTTAELIEHSVATWGGTLIIGKDLNVVTVATGEADCVISRLPGGSGVAILPSGPTSICDYDLLTKQGKIDNKLLAQTLALGLNLGIGTPLGDVQLDQGWIVTAATDGGCGSDIPLYQDCIYEETDVNQNGVLDLIDVVNPYWYVKIDQSVLDMIAAITQPATIAGLYELANQALGGWGTYEKSQLTAIAGAVDKINNVFDECRLLIGYMEEKPECDPYIVFVDSEEAKSAEISTPLLNASSLKVYPNPFSDKVMFEFVSGADAHAVLEINNMLGQKVATLLDKQVSKGVMNRIEYEPKDVISGIYLYRLTLDGNVQIGKLIYRK